MNQLKEQYRMETGLRCTHPTEGFVFGHYVNWLEVKVEKFTSTNSAMDAIRKAYIEGYSMGHHHTVESCYWPEQAADDWLSEQHQ